MPLVSIIMPSYNAEIFISEAIDSVLRQSFNDWELIVIDDGSTDNTVEKVERFNDKRIKLVKNSYNMGISFSTNKGLDASNGKYIALLDDDDIAEPQRLEYQVEYLEEHSDIDIIGGRLIYIDAHGDVIDYGGKTRTNPNYIKAMLLFGSVDIENVTLMYRKDFIDRYDIRYRENCLGMQDYKFYIECSKVGKISSIDRFLTRHRMHENNETYKQMTQNAEERAKVYKQFKADSLKMSGFFVSEDDLNVIADIFPEAKIICDSFDRCKELWRVLNNILLQAKEKNVDYYPELCHVCRWKISQALSKVNYFEDKGAVEFFEK